MRAKLSLAIASVLVGAIAATAPADAACKKFGFTVNDYGKEGPTNDAKNLLDKHISEWAAQNGVTAYQTGKKSVNCELFLDVLLFDEHTCTASASVCWGDGVKPNNKGAEQAEVTGDGNGEVPPAPVSKAVAMGIPAQPQTAAAAPAAPPTEAAAAPTAPVEQIAAPAETPAATPAVHTPAAAPAATTGRSGDRSPAGWPGLPPPSRTSRPRPPHRHRIRIVLLRLPPLQPPPQQPSAPRWPPKRQPMPPRKLPPPPLLPAPRARVPLRCRRSTTLRAPRQRTTSDPRSSARPDLTRRPRQLRAFLFAPASTSRRSRWRSSVSSSTPPTAAQEASRAPWRRR